MPDDLNRTPIQIAWLGYVKSVQALLVPQIDDRPLDQYLAFRDAVLALVQGEPFLEDLNQGWTQTNLPPYPRTTAEILLLEIQAFPRAVEVSQSTAKPEESKGWWRTMLGRAATVSGSVSDLLENLPPHAKQGLTLFKELIDLFKGKD